MVGNPSRTQGLTRGNERKTANRQSQQLQPSRRLRETARLISTSDLNTKAQRSIAAQNQTEQGYARTEQASSPMVAAAFERLGFSVFDLDDLRSGELEQM